MITALIGAVYSDIAEIISFLGGCCSTLMMFAFPAMILVQSSDKGLKDTKVLISVIVMACLTLLGYYAGIYTLVGIFNGVHGE